MLPQDQKYAIGTLSKTRQVGVGEKEISLVQQELKYFDSFESVCLTASQTNLSLTCGSIWTRYLSSLEWFRSKPANVCHLWILSNPSLRISHNLSQVSSVCSSGWWKLGPDGTKLLFREQGCSQDVDIFFCYFPKILFRGFSNVLSPGKAISPSVRTIITAVFILFLFVLMGLSNIIFVSVLHKGFRMLWNQATRSQRCVKTWLLLS